MAPAKRGRGLKGSSVLFLVILEPCWVLILLTSSPFTVKTPRAQSDTLTPALVSGPQGRSRFGLCSALKPLDVCLDSEQAEAYSGQLPRPVHNSLGSKLMVSKRSRWDRRAGPLGCLKAIPRQFQKYTGKELEGMWLGKFQDVLPKNICAVSNSKPSSGSHTEEGMRQPHTLGQGQLRRLKESSEMIQPLFLEWRGCVAWLSTQGCHRTNKGGTFLTSPLTLCVKLIVLQRESCRFYV